MPIRFNSVHGRTLMGYHSSTALEEGAIPLPDYQHPDNAVCVFGPEDGTISQAIIDRVDAVVYVPTVDCMNLAASVNVVLYDRLAKSAS